MALQETANKKGGEKDDMKFVDWLKQNDLDLTQNTIEILSQQGLSKISKIKKLIREKTEINDFCIRFNIGFSDQLTLNRSFDIWSKETGKSGQILMSTQEINALVEMKKKIREMEDLVFKLNHSNDEIEKERSRMEQEIKKLFVVIRDSIDKREKHLLKDLDDIIQKKKNIVKNKIAESKKVFENAQKVNTECAKMVSEPVELEKVSERQITIIKNKDDIMGIDMELLKYNNQIIQFIANQNTIINVIGSFGRVVYGKSVLFEKVEVNGSGKVKVNWKLNGFDDEKFDYNNNNRFKLKMEWIENNTNDNDNNENVVWKQKLVDLNADNGVSEFDIRNIGSYYVRLQLMDGNEIVFEGESKVITVDSVGPPQLSFSDNNMNLSENEKELLSDWLCCNIIGNDYKNNDCELKDRLLFDGDTNGYNADGFHSNVDKKKQVITLVETNYKHIFAGYTSVGFDSIGRYVKDSKSFLCLIRTSFPDRKPKLCPVKMDHQCALYCHPSYGPTFGGNHDVYIDNDMHGNSNYSYPKHKGRDTSYKDVRGNELCGGDQLKLDGKHNFKVNKIQTFQIS